MNTTLPRESFSLQGRKPAVFSTPVLQDGSTKEHVPDQAAQKRQSRMRAVFCCSFSTVLGKYVHLVNFLCPWGTDDGRKVLRGEIALHSILMFGMWELSSVLWEARALL